MASMSLYVRPPSCHGQLRATPRASVPHKTVHISVASWNTRVSAALARGNPGVVEEKEPTLQRIREDLIGQEVHRYASSNEHFFSPDDLPESLLPTVHYPKLVGAAARLAASGVAAFVLSSLMQFSPLLSPPAVANEQSILSFGPSKEGFVVDDAGVLNRVTKSELKRLLGELEANEGYHIDMITIRKLTTRADAFEFADQVLEKWYPTIEEGDRKGIVLLVTTQKEGAVTGGPSFIKAVGEPVLEAVDSENLPVLATDEKYNEAFSSTAKRLVNAIRGLPDIAGPKFQENKRESNFRTKEETDEKRGQFSIVVGGLLVIAFVVPMAQYYAYVSKK